MNGNPTYRDLIDHDGKPSRISYAKYMHPNPRWWKYQWRVFHRSSKEGRAFFSTQKLSTHAAMKLIKELVEKNEGYLLYNSSQPRRGKDTPFDLTHKRWTDCTPALPYDDDDDPEWHGHK